MRGWNYACGKALYPRQRLPFVNRGGRDPGTTPAKGLRTFDLDIDARDKETPWGNHACGKALYSRLPDATA
jgi:hypothetical protein